MRDTWLGAKMRTLAEEGHARAGELTERADNFETASYGFLSDPRTVSQEDFMVAWDAARTLWSECGGGPLLS